ncbi:class I SAM-dependent methyltransferase [Salinibacter sp.]|uniref:class I SAM-dependent methyltransferase n=1 Tax=Salinibacter sp. TaxID=2065818 RepID=UPI0021E73733|nr:methyltransferase domain-containing protein [Salinibacter sp.]
MSLTQTTDSLTASNPSWTQWWNRTRYQLYAPIYDAVARPLERGRKRAVDQLDLQSGERVLILGAGTGSDLNYLPDDVQVTAIDAVPAMVRRTRKRAERLGRDVDARVGDAQDLPFEDDAFDAVLLHLILSVVPSPEAVTAETARVLTPGGRLSIYDKFVPEGTEPSLLRRALNPVARFLFSDLTRKLDPLLSRAGLEFVEPRKSALGGLYTIALARPTADGASDESPTSVESTQTVR